MDTQPVRAAVDKAQDARADHDLQRERARKLDAELGPLRILLDAAESALTQCLGADELGEGSPAATKKARAERDAISERVRGIIAALEVLHGREPELARRADQLERAAREAALPLARSLAEHELERCQRLFESAAMAFSLWHWLDTFILGSEDTGPNQADRAGVAAIFEKHDIYARPGYIECGNGNGTLQPMTTAELLALCSLEAVKVAAE